MAALLAAISVLACAVLIPVPPLPPPLEPLKVNTMVSAASFKLSAVITTVTICVPRAVKLSVPLLEAGAL